MCFKWRLFRQEDLYFTEQDKIYEKIGSYQQKGFKIKKGPFGPNLLL